MNNIIYARAYNKFECSSISYVSEEGSIEKFAQVPNRYVVILICEIDGEEVRQPLPISSFRQHFAVIGDIDDLMKYLKIKEKK